MSEGIRNPFERELDDTVDVSTAQSLFPFNDAAVHALQQLTFRQLRDLLYMCFGDHPDFDNRLATLYAGVADMAREKA